MLLFKCIIPGRPYLKKTTMRRFRNGGFKFSDNYLQWQDQARLAIRAAVRMQQPSRFPIRCQIRLCVLSYFENHQSEPDLSALYEGIQDLLQAEGVIENDRLIYSHDGSTKIFGQGACMVLHIYSLG
jgi:Holliday junction resolvase RusA-like endonuclease